MTSFRCRIAYVLGAWIALSFGGGGLSVAQAAGVPALSANQARDFPEMVLRTAFVPVGPRAPAPVAFDPSVKTGGPYDWSPVFDPDGIAEGPAATDGGGVLSPSSLPFTPELRTTLADVNRIENARRFGPDHRHLDCVGYVLAKREALIRVGLPADALSPAVVRTRGGVVHAVLLVTTSAGDQVLDNLSPYVDPWRRVDYEWIKRQVPSGDGSRWAWIERSGPSPLKIASGR